LRKRKYSHDIYLTGCLDAAASRISNSACQFAAHFHLQTRKSGTRLQSKKMHLLFSNHGFVFCVFVIYCLVRFSYFRAHMILLLHIRACRRFSVYVSYISQISDYCCRCLSPWRYRCCRCFCRLFIPRETSVGSVATGSRFMCIYIYMCLLIVSWLARLHQLNGYCVNNTCCLFCLYFIVCFVALFAHALWMTFGLLNKRANK
jgi:hypothetical protein